MIANTSHWSSIFTSVFNSIKTLVSITQINAGAGSSCLEDWDTRHFLRDFSHVFYVNS